MMTPPLPLIFVIVQEHIGTNVNQGWELESHESELQNYLCVNDSDVTPLGPTDQEVNHESEKFKSQRHVYFLCESLRVLVDFFAPSA